MSGFLVESPNAERAVDKSGRVRDVPRPNFALYYHPAEWQLAGDGELLPSLSHMSLAPGAGADEHGDFSRRHAELTARGYVQIPHNVLGAAMPDYVAKYRNQRGKGVHRTVFQVPYNDQSGNTRWRADDDAIRAFVTYLRKRGVVQRPTPPVIEGLIAEFDRKLRRQSQITPAGNHSARERHEKKMQAYELALGVLRRELAEAVEAYGAPASPARSAIFSLLEEAEPEAVAADEVAAKVRTTRKKKPAESPPPPADDDGGFDVDDGE
jgi:hypothetical protein